MSAPHATGGSGEPANPRELLIDIMRGWVLFLMVFFENLEAALKAMPANRFTSVLMRVVIEHRDWHGLSYADVAFPTFVALMGASLVPMVRAKVARGESTKTIARHILVRFAFLYLVAFFAHGGLAHWPAIRLLAGVLHRLSFCYLATGLVVLLTRERTWKIIVAGLLIVYWLLLVVAGPADPYAPGTNISNVIDVALHGRTYSESIVGTPPAVATCILGALLGSWLLRVPHDARPRPLAAAGLLLVGAGLVWAQWFLVNKHLWTSSFVLVVFGVLLLHLSVVSVVAERWNKAWLFRPLTIMGAHVLVAYSLPIFLDFPALAARLVGGSNVTWWGYRPLAIAFAAGVLNWLTVYAWHRVTRRASSSNVVASESAAAPAPR